MNWDSDSMDITEPTCWSSALSCSDLSLSKNVAKREGGISNYPAALVPFLRNHSICVEVGDVGDNNLLTFGIAKSIQASSSNGMGVSRCSIGIKCHMHQSDEGTFLYVEGERKEKVCEKLKKVCAHC